MPEILFHQYDSSPFSEKVRVCLGIKKLAWRCVDQPVIMPKPELVALTGGYRRIPVMHLDGRATDQGRVARAVPNVDAKP